MRGRLRSEDGMTIVEVLVSMTVSLLVLTAVLGIFEGFERGAKANERLTEAQDTARRGMSTMVTSLRSAGSPATGLATAATVVRAGADDLVVLTTNWPGESRSGTGVHRVRYCLNAARDTIWFEGLKAGTAGPTDPGTACPGTAAGWQRRTVVGKVANAASEPVFTYGTTNGAVRSVGILLAIQAGTSERARPKPLRSAVTLRGAVLPDVQPDDITATCLPDGSGTLLSLGAALLQQADPLKLLPVAGTPGVAVGPLQVLVPKGTAVIQLAVKNLLGLQQILLKPVPAC